MTNRENILALLHYQPYEKLPVIAFGYWPETLDKWAEEGHIPSEWAEGYRQQGDGGAADRAVMDRLGFDCNWQPTAGVNAGLCPGFEPELLEEKTDGSRVMRNQAGLIQLVKPGVISIPAEIGTTLTDREAWETLYLPKLRYTAERVDTASLRALPPPEERQNPLGLHCGSLMGSIRDLLGVEQLSYLLADDWDLYLEIIDTVGDLTYRCVETALNTGVRFDYAHFWEDICFKNGPLVIPSVFDDYVGPHYRRITSLLREHGVDIVSLDCDGLIDSLIPTWVNNGVNTMFPIEVGTWKASIAPWREQYGRELRGVGGMNKTVFSQDYRAVDREIERLKPLIALGGYIPCPDHRIAPDAVFENVQYYCDRLHNLPLSGL